MAEDLRPQDEELRQRAYVKAARSELLRYGSPQRMWYFQKLELHPVKLNFTFRGVPKCAQPASDPHRSPHAPARAKRRPAPVRWLLGATQPRG